MTLEGTYVMFSPLEDFVYLFTNAVFGDSTIEDVILFIGTVVAFIAFVLWCCFPIQTRGPSYADMHDSYQLGPEEYNQLIILEYDLAPT